MNTVKLICLIFVSIGCITPEIRTPQELLSYMASHEVDFVKEQAYGGILYRMRFNPPVALLDENARQSNCDSIYNHRKKYVYFKLSFLKDKNAALGTGSPDLHSFLQELSFEMTNRISAVTKRKNYKPIDAQYIRSFSPNEGAYLLVVFDKEILDETDDLVLTCQIKSLGEELSFAFDPQLLLTTYDIIAC